ncbi:PAS domain S-box containing protein [Nitzschia inconspicua]|uniref:PAS domain S-box containing protein n=1 Tax=Nitzschia inconspicua TaxID=303405 RepID=A0A9K3PYK1_9STRA|nr:PAS domain S-box containing protein [Nitzschia inconspicua]
MNNAGVHSNRNTTSSSDHTAAGTTHSTGGMPPGPVAAPASNHIAPAVLLQNNATTAIPAAMGTGPAGGIVYDISSLDPLQAHALQLTASAGLVGQLNNGAIPLLAATTTSQPPADTPGGAPSQQQQQPLFLFPHHQISTAQTNSAAITGSQTQPSINSLIAPAGGPPGNNPQSLLFPAVAAGGPHAALAATLASQAGGYAQLLAAQGLLPPQYLNIANGSMTATPGTTTPPPSQSLTTPQSFVPLATVAPTPATSQSLPAPQSFVPLSAINDNNNKRPPDILGAVSNDNKRQKQFPTSIISSLTDGNQLARNTIIPQIPTPMTTSDSAAFSGQDPLPPKEASEEDLSRMTPAERRRYERNLREQQRSYRISQQIKELRDILVDSKFPFKPNKYSILLSVVDYIKQLQSRAIMLDTEHSKLIKTIRETNDRVNTGTAPTSTDESVNAASTAESGSDSEMLFVKGIDYRSVFDQCPAALGIAALDGRILECNMEFQTILGFSDRDDVLKQSLFNLVQNHQDIFRAMAQMLKTVEDPIRDTQSRDSTNAFSESNIAGPNAAVDAGSAAADSVTVSKDRFWTGPVTSKLNIKLLMNITLTVGDNGTPKFFSCSVTSSDT